MYTILCHIGEIGDLVSVNFLPSQGSRLPPITMICLCEVDSPVGNAEPKKRQIGRMVREIKYCRDTLFSLDLVIDPTNTDDSDIEDIHNLELHQFVKLQYLTLRGVVLPSISFQHTSLTCLRLEQPGRTNVYSMEEFLCMLGSLSPTLSTLHIRDYLSTVRWTREMPRDRRLVQFSRTSCIEIEDDVELLALFMRFVFFPTTTELEVVVKHPEGRNPAPELIDMFSELNYCGNLEVLREVARITIDVLLEDPVRPQPWLYICGKTFGDHDHESPFDLGKFTLGIKGTQWSLKHDLFTDLLIGLEWIFRPHPQSLLPNSLRQLSIEGDLTIISTDTWKKALEPFVFLEDLRVKWTNNTGDLDKLFHALAPIEHGSKVIESVLSPCLQTLELRGVAGADPVFLLGVCQFAVNRRMRKCSPRRFYLQLAGYLAPSTSKELAEKVIYQYLMSSMPDCTVEMGVNSLVITRSDIFCTTGV